MTFNRGNSDQVLDYLDDFLRGFRGRFNRTWCAQTFYQSHPACLQETIWNETVESKQPSTWEMLKTLPNILAE